MRNPVARKSRGRNPLQWLLVGIQVALAVTLLAGAGLLLRSFQELGRVSRGFDSSHILTFQLSMNWGETGDMKKLRQFTDRLLETLRATPGVEAAAISVGVPGVPFRYETELKLIEGRAETEPKLIAENRFVSASYFATMRIPLLAGEVCRETDGPPTVVVNRSLRRRLFPRRPRHWPSRAIAESWATPAQPKSSASPATPAKPASTISPFPPPTGALPSPNLAPIFLVRTRNAPMTMAETIRRQIHDVDPQRSVYDFAPLEQHFSDALAENRLRTILLTFFAATALSLACIGLYGTLSYNVNVRQREVGLRLALGALRGQIVKQFLWQGLAVCLAGLRRRIRPGRRLHSPPRRPSLRRLPHRRPHALRASSCSSSSSPQPPPSSPPSAPPASNPCKSSATSNAHKASHLVLCAQNSPDRTTLKAVNKPCRAG